MTSLSPAQRRRRLSVGAFLVLGGLWSFSVWLAAVLWLREGIARDNPLRFVALGQVILTWLGLLVWERSFRRRYLPPAASRPWIAWCVLVPLTFSGLALVYGKKLHRRAPGSYETNTYFRWIPYAAGAQRPITPEDLEAGKGRPRTVPEVVLHIYSRKSNWGLAQRSVRFGESRVYLNDSASGPGWSIDREGKFARKLEDRSTKIELNPDEWKRIVGDLVGDAWSPAQVEAVARSLDDYVTNRGPLPPSLRGYPWIYKARVSHLASGNAGVVTWNWPLLAAGLFTVLMLLLTWIGVRVTMFPRSEEILLVEGPR